MINLSLLNYNLFLLNFTLIFLPASEPESGSESCRSLWNSASKMLLKYSFKNMLEAYDSVLESHFHSLKKLSLCIEVFIKDNHIFKNIMTINYKVLNN